MHSKIFNAIAILALLGASGLQAQVSRIFYVSGSVQTGAWELWMMEADGDNPTQLTSGSGISWRAHSNTGLAISPDGSQLAFGAQRGRDFDIYALDVESGSEVRLTKGGFNTNPAYAPDGRIFFRSGLGDGKEDIYVMDADGSNQTVLGLASEVGGRLAGLSVSPDGTRIVFAGRSVADKTWDLYVVRVDGTGLVQLTADPLMEANPVWSPDGEKIAFDREGLDIFVIDAKGGNEVGLAASSDAAESEPAWSSDGRQIVYSSDQDAPGEFGLEIFRMNADGSAKTQLTFNSSRRSGRLNLGAVWSGPSVAATAIHPLTWGQIKQDSR